MNEPEEATLKRFFAALVLAASPLWACADGLSGLEEFLRTARSGSADFTQSVTAPPKDGQAARTKTSSGTFMFQRPGRFSFVYRKPFEQTIVADGRTLWLYDADLNQVTQREQAQVLGQTPAALIAAAPDLRALQAEFTLTAAPDRDGLQWVSAAPKARDGQLQQVLVGFDGERLAALEILDSFGQRSVMKFGRIEVNPALPASTFQFKPPVGADVLRQ